MGSSLNVNLSLNVVNSMVTVSETLHRVEEKEEGEEKVRKKQKKQKKRERWFLLSVSFHVPETMNRESLFSSVSFHIAEKEGRK